MATRKKKTKEVEPSTKITWPQVTQGSHLTVTRYEDGTVVLEWDDEALERDVKQALASVKNKVKLTAE